MPTRNGGAVGTTSATYTFTAGRGGFGHVKFENGATLNTTFNDSNGNTWTVAQQSNYSASPAEPQSAIIYCLSITTGGATTVTPTFSAGSPTFQRIEIEEWTSATGSWAVDVIASATQGTLSGSAFNITTPTATATANGVAVLGFSAYGALGTPLSGGTPSFTVSNGGAANNDSLLGYASVTAGSVTPGINVTGGGGGRYVSQLIIFKESTGGGSTAVPVFLHNLRQQGIA